jgi:hypothetical protein
MASGYSAFRCFGTSSNIASIKSTFSSGKPPCSDSRSPNFPQLKRESFWSFWGERGDCPEYRAEDR